MASSGSKTFIYEHAKAWQLKFSWQVLETSIYDNTSTISWGLTLLNTSVIAHNLGIQPKPFYVKIDGNTVSSGTKIFYSIPSGSSAIVASGISTVAHNANGTKTFSFEVSLQIGATLAGAALSVGGTGTGTLDTFHRGATLQNFTFLTDEDSPILQLSNPCREKASLQACFYFTDASESSPDIPYKNINNGASVAISLTEDDKKGLWQGFNRSAATYPVRTIKCTLKTVIDGITYTDTKETNITFVNHFPLVAPTVVATDARTKTLTGDSSGNTLIKYYSDVAFTVGAQARKEASIDYRTITCGSKVLDDYASDSGTISDIESNTFYFSATDTRKNTTREAIVFNGSNGRNFVNYIKLTNNIKSVSLGATNVLTFTIEGKYFNGSFGAKNNSLEIEYLLLDESGEPEFNKEGSGWVRLGTVTPNVDGDSYTFTYSISGVDYKKQHTLTINAIDELTPIQRR